MNGNREMLSQARPVIIEYFLAVVSTIISVGNFFIARAFHDNMIPDGLAE